MNQKKLIPSFHQKPKENEIYIKNNRPLSAYKKRVIKLIQKDFKEIKLLALSSAMIKAIQIVQEIRQTFPLMIYDIKTDTVECFYLIDNQIKKSKRSTLKITLKF